MARNTCMSLITYQNETDRDEINFRTVIENLMETMYEQDKTGIFPNWIKVGGRPLVAYHQWHDHAAAQEFIDFVIANAPTYNVTVISTKIQDFYNDQIG